MRTALILLFVIAVASIFGSVFPQRPVSPDRVQEYLERNPTIGQVLDRVGMFDVFGSAWFTAIYVALLTALVACLVPRSRALARLLVAKPARGGRLGAYRNYDSFDLPGVDPAAAAEALRGVLGGRRYRVAAYPPDTQAARPSEEQAERVAGAELAAEKGYLREAGSILFHISFLLLLVGLVVGKGFGFRGQATIIEGDSWVNTRINYDAFQPGRFYHPTGLPGFTLRLEEFTNSFYPNGAPADYGSTMTATSASGEVQRQRVAVNRPLTVDGVRVFQSDYGYAPHLRITDAAGKIVLDGPVEMLRDPSTEVSNRGLRLPALKSDIGQVGLQLTFFTGLEQGSGGTFPNRPQLTNPVLVVLPLHGDLRAGQPGSVFTLDTSRLEPMGDRPLVLRPGQSGKLPNGATVQFPDLRQYTVVTLARDPGVPIVGVAAALLLAGLLPSLYVRRRRVWARVRSSADGGSQVELAGLAYQGKDAFVLEFSELCAQARSALGVARAEGGQRQGEQVDTGTTLADEPDERSRQRA
jgi:cytochrome c biogenesis protein